MRLLGRIVLLLWGILVVFVKLPVVAGADERPDVEYIEDIEVVGTSEISEIIEQIPTEKTTEYRIEATPEDIDLLARMVMSESSILCYEAKVAVACTAVNRVMSDYKDFAEQSTVSDVIYYPNAYWIGDNGEPTIDCYYAVYDALTYEVYPRDMYFFYYNPKYSECYGFSEEIQPAYGQFYTVINGLVLSTINNYND